MFRVNGWKRYLIKIISIIIVICFVSYDIAWAYPDFKRPNSSTVIPETLFTSPDSAESFARITAKQLDMMMKKHFPKMPLAGVEEMLEYLREIALSKLQIKGESFRVAGGAEAGELFIYISDSCVLRYYNPKMRDLSFPAGNYVVAREESINKYLNFQLLKSGSAASAPESSAQPAAEHEMIADANAPEKTTTDVAAQKETGQGPLDTGGAVGGKGLASLLLALGISAESFLKPAEVVAGTLNGRYAPPDFERGVILLCIGICMTTGLGVVLSLVLDHFLFKHKKLRSEEITEKLTLAREDLSLAAEKSKNVLGVLDEVPLMRNLDICDMHEKVLNLSKAINKSISPAAAILIVFMAKDGGKITDREFFEKQIIYYNDLESSHSVLPTVGCKIHLYRRDGATEYEGDELKRFQDKASDIFRRLGFEARSPRLLKGMEDIELEVLVPPSFSHEVIARLLFYMMKNGLLDRARYDIEIQFTFEGNLTDEAKYISFALLASRFYEVSYARTLTTLMGEEASILISGGGVFKDIRKPEEGIVKEIFLGIGLEILCIFIGKRMIDIFYEIFGPFGQRKRTDYLGLLLPHFDPKRENLIFRLYDGSLIYSTKKLPNALATIVKDIQLLNLSLSEYLKLGINPTKNGRLANVYGEFKENVKKLSYSFGMPKETFTVTWLGEYGKLRPKTIWRQLYPYLDKLHQVKMDNPRFQPAFVKLLNDTADQIERIVKKKDKGEPPGGATGGKGLASLLLAFGISVGSFVKPGEVAAGTFERVTGTLGEQIMAAHPVLPLLIGLGVVIGMALAYFLYKHKERAEGKVEANDGEVVSSDARPAADNEQSEQSLQNLVSELERIDPCFSEFSSWEYARTILKIGELADENNAGRLADKLDEVLTRSRNKVAWEAEAIRSASHIALLEMLVRNVAGENANKIHKRLYGDLSENAKKFYDKYKIYVFARPTDSSLFAIWEALVGELPGHIREHVGVKMITDVSPQPVSYFTEEGTPYLKNKQTIVLEKKWSYMDEAGLRNILRHVAFRCIIEVYLAERHPELVKKYLRVGRWKLKKVGRLEAFSKFSGSELAKALQNGKWKSNLPDTSYAYKGGKRVPAEDLADLYAAWKENSDVFRTRVEKDKGLRDKLRVLEEMLGEGEIPSHQEKSFPGRKTFFSIILTLGIPLWAPFVTPVMARLIPPVPVASPKVDPKELKELEDKNREALMRSLDRDRKEHRNRKELEEARITILKYHKMGRVRAGAARDLGETMDSKEAEEALIEALLADEDPIVRFIVAKGLGKTIRGSKEIEEALTAALLRDTDHTVRAAAARALGESMGSKEVEDALIQALSGDNEELIVRYSAVKSLGKIGRRSKEAEKALIKVLRDENRGVRAAAAEALGKTGGKKAKKALKRALKDKEPNVSKAAREALKNLEGAINAPSQKSSIIPGGLKSVVGIVSLLFVASNASAASFIVEAGMELWTAIGVLAALVGIFSIITAKKPKFLKAKGKGSTAGSIRGVFEYLCDNNITSTKTALTGREIARRLDRSFESIKDDLRDLRLHLRLIEVDTRADTGKDAKYFVPESVRNKASRILPILSRFRGKFLRPKVAHLKEVYRKRIKPILEFSEFTLKTETLSDQKILKAIKRGWQVFRGEIPSAREEEDDSEDDSDDGIYLSMFGVGGLYYMGASLLKRLYKKLFGMRRLITPGSIKQIAATATAAVGGLSEGIIKSIFEKGILSQAAAKGEGIEVHGSADVFDELTPENRHIACNLLRINPANNNRPIVEKALYNKHYGFVQVIMERRNDVDVGIIKKEEAEGILADRTKYGIILIIDPEYARPGSIDREVIRQLWHTLEDVMELELDGRIPPEAIKAVIYPEGLASLIEKTCPASVEKIKVSGVINKELEVRRDVKAEDGGNVQLTRMMQFNIPDYESALNEYLDRNRGMGVVIVHGVRLRAPSDTITENMPKDAPISDEEALDIIDGKYFEKKKMKETGPRQGLKPSPKALAEDGHKEDDPKGVTPESSSIAPAGKRSPETPKGEAEISLKEAYPVLAGMKPEDVGTEAAKLLRRCCSEARNYLNLFGRNYKTAGEALGVAYQVLKNHSQARGVSDQAESFFNVYFYLLEALGQESQELPGSASDVIELLRTSGRSVMFQDRIDALIRIFEGDEERYFGIIKELKALLLKAPDVKKKKIGTLELPTTPLFQEIEDKKSQTPSFVNLEGELLKLYSKDEKARRLDLDMRRMLARCGVDIKALTGRLANKGFSELKSEATRKGLRELAFSVLRSNLLAETHHPIFERKGPFSSDKIKAALNKLLRTAIEKELDWVQV
ncbi:MAG: HEAT repeat domain-containing protein, partial [Candidatus Omnitrophota bacterium]